MIEKVDFAKAKELTDTEKDIVILDVREEEEYITGHMSDAVLFPVDDITDESAGRVIGKKTTPVLVYCRSGRRSAEAAEKLESFGYHIIYDAGGLIGWPYGLE